MKSLNMTGFIMKHPDAQVNTHDIMGCCQMQHNRFENPRVVIMTTCGATSDRKVDIMLISV